MWRVGLVRPPSWAAGSVRCRTPPGGAGISRSAPWYEFVMLSGRRLRLAGSLRVAAALACAGCLCGATVHAQSTADDLARRHFDSGVAYLEESDYDNALKAFQKAYDLSKRP